MTYDVNNQLIKQVKLIIRSSFKLTCVRVSEDRHEFLLFSWKFSSMSIITSLDGIP